MRTRTVTWVLLAAMATVVAVGVGPVSADTGTAITYQGRLIDNDEYADGLYDMMFKLKLDPVGAPQVGPQLQIDDVEVLDGFFTVDLDFGTGVFDGNDRYLQIGVRTADLDDPNGYTYLTPRQRIMPTPYAIHAGPGAGGSVYTGVAPITVNQQNGQIGLNPATAIGDLMSWDGTNWIALPPAPHSHPEVHTHTNHDNMQPWLGIYHIIALQGVFPSRNGSDPFLAEITMFAGNFAPRGWAFCDGQLLPISQYSAVFSLMGTTYGGDGRTTFALPDLRGRVTVHPGNGPGLSPRQWGQRGGAEQLSH